MEQMATVRVEDGRIAAVTIDNNWRERTDVAGLSAALTDSIHAQLPPVAQQRTVVDAPSGGGEVTLGQLRDAMALHMEWMQRAADYQRRVQAGAFATAREDITDPRDRCHVSFDPQGRFDRFDFDPAWAAEAPVQALTDVVWENLGEVDLAPVDGGIAERRALQDLDLKIRQLVGQGAER